MKPMFPEFNEAVRLIVNTLLPEGFDITDDPTLVDTWDKLNKHREKTGRILVWSGGSDATIFGDPKVNHAFRAWHDYVHLLFRFPFTKEGEHWVMLVQQRQLERMCAGLFTPAQIAEFNLILECEVDGQLEYFLKHKKFLEDQRAFTKEWLHNRKLALS